MNNVSIVSAVFWNASSLADKSEKEEKTGGVNRFPLQRRTLLNYYTAGGGTKALGESVAGGAQSSSEERHKNTIIIIRSAGTKSRHTLRESGQSPCCLREESGPQFLPVHCHCNRARNNNSSTAEPREPCQGNKKSSSYKLSGKTGSWNVGRERRRGQRHLWPSPLLSPALHSTPAGSQVPSSKNARKQSQNRQKIELHSWRGGSFWRKIKSSSQARSAPATPPALDSTVRLFLFAGDPRPEDWETGSTSSACHSSEASGGRGGEDRESGMQSAPAPQPGKRGGFRVDITIPAE